MTAPLSSRQILALALAGALVGAPAAAQDTTPPNAAPASDDWQLTLALPIWMAASDTRIHTDELDVDSHVSFGDTLEDLELGLMMGAAARKGKLSLDANLLWTRISDESSVQLGPGVLPFPPTDVEFEIDQVIFEALAGWAVLDRPLSSRANETRRVVFDLRGGVRYWFIGSHLDAHLELPNPLPDLDRDVDDSIRFADLILGGRVRVDLAERIALLFAGDYGGFHISSDSTWSWGTQVWWAFGEKWRAFGGYRMTEVDRNDANVQVKGPVLGVAREF
jgi:hypothetical protein